MQGVGPGSLLGGRYLVSRRVAQHTRYERWSATDQVLERDVVLVCFDADGPIGSATTDAARRASGVEDHRLVRVLDVGREGTLAFVVEEPLRGAQSMTTVLGDGGLPSEEARRVVGEAASALESARVRGLHHGVLTPRSVLRLEDGTVKVRGLATEAALLEADDTTSDEASRADTVALVALSYAALTGRWPSPEGDSGLEAAPRVAGGVAPPSEIAAGVPGDLDLLARTTLNEDHGPATPGELAQQIGPWSPVPVLGTATPKPGPGTRTEPFSRDPGTGGLARDATVRPTGGAGRPSRAPAGTPTTGPLRTPVPSAGRGTPTTSTITGPDDLDGGDPETDGPGRGAVVAASVAAGAAGVAAGKAAVRRVGTAFGVVGDRVGGMARSAADTAAERSAARAERRESERFDDGDYYVEDVRLSDTLETTDEPLSPVLLLPGTATEPLDRDQSRWVLMGLVAAVLVAAVLGVWGLPKLSGVGTGGAAAPMVTRTVTASPGATPSASVQPAPAPSSSAPAAAQPVAIRSGSQLDLEQGGIQASRTAPLAYDGNPATMWQSSKWYATANFGGVKKQGLGLLLDLGAPTDVHKVDFSVVGPVNVTIYVASQPTISGAQAIGSVTGQNGSGTLSVANGGSAKGNLVIVWFTSLGPDGTGKFRAQVSEVTVS